jgi:hypothetical protein
MATPAGSDIAGTAENKTVEFVSLLVNKTRFVDLDDGTHVNDAHISTDAFVMYEV